MKRRLQIRRAILQALDDVPDNYLLPQDTLSADAGRRVLPAPTRSEFEAELRRADEDRLVAGITTADEGAKWKITDAGRVWLSERP